RDDDERAHNDERSEPPRPRDAGVDADRRGESDRARGEGPERPARDPRPQRPPPQLVERVRAHAQRERERAERRYEAWPRKRRREPRPYRDVRQVPERVRRMQERHVVPPASGRERVEGWPRLGAHARRPQMTTPPPRLSRR